MSELSLQGILDSDTVSCTMVNQVQHLVAIDLFDIHGNALIKMCS